MLSSLFRRQSPSSSSSYSFLCQQHNWTSVSLHRRWLREVRVTEGDKETVVEGVRVHSDRAERYGRNTETKHRI